MNLFAKVVLASVLAILLLVSVVTISICFAGGVTDDNNNLAGQILVGTGENHGKDSVGHWTDITDIPGLKGEKGDKGDQGIQGIQGITGKDGLNGINGINGIDGLNGIDGIDGYTPIKGVDYFDGLNGTDGQNGINGLDGAKGDTGNNGKDVDPTTVTNLQNNINTVDMNSILRDNNLQSRLNSTNSRIDGLNDRVSQLERTQYVLETSFRILDTQRISLRPFFRHNFTAGKIDVVGLKIDVKLGRSYEEKLIAKVNARLDALERAIGHAPVIEKVVDAQGNIKSISITSNGLAVNSTF
jgi:hypothetical protein